MEQVLNTILSELKEMRSDIHDLKLSMNNLQEDVNVIKSDVKILQSDVNVLKVDVKTLQSDVTFLKVDVLVLKSGQTKVESLISDIPKQFEKLADSIGLDLERHQRIIDLLSTKSIEHEADMKHVKSMILNQ